MLVYEAQTQATSVCGFKLLLYEGLKLLVYEATDLCQHT